MAGKYCLVGVDGNAYAVMGVNVSTLNKDPDCLKKIVIGSNQNIKVIFDDLLKETK